MNPFVKAFILQPLCLRDMGKRYVGLLDLSQRKIAFRALLIFSASVYSQNIFALSAFQPTSGFINTGIKILNDERVDGVPFANMEVWKFFGFESAAEMNAKMDELHIEHSKVLEGIANKTASIENLAVLPDGFEGPAGIIKNGQFQQKSLVASSGKASAPNDMVSSLPTPIKTNMASPLSIAEGGKALGSPGCKAGSPCAMANSLADSYASEFSKDAPYFSASDFSRKSVADSSSRVPASSGTFNPTAHNGFQTGAISNTQYANVMKDTIEAGLNPADGEKLDTKSLQEFANLGIESILKNPELFEFMPESWFAEKKTITVNGKDVPVMIRGNLDRPYNAKDPNDVNNYYQIAVLQDVPGMKAQVITLKKDDPAKMECNGNTCNPIVSSTSHHKKYRDFFAKMWAQKKGRLPAEKLKLPVMPLVIDSLSNLTIALNNPSALIAKSAAYQQQFQSALESQNASGKLKLDHRWTQQEFLEKALPESIEYYIREQGRITES